MAVDFKLDYTAEEINERLGVQPVSMELLWENASPTSEFPAQTISTDLNGQPLDLSEYDAIEIDYYAVNNPYGIETTTIFKRNSATPRYVYTYNMLEGSISIGYFRGVTMYPTSIVMQDAYSKGFNATTRAIENTRIIPYRIYGIKGVK